MIELDKITDTKELKSLAYDQIAIKENADNNLRALNQRIAELINSEEQNDGNNQSKEA